MVSVYPCYDYYDEEEEKEEEWVGGNGAEIVKEEERGRKGMKESTREREWEWQREKERERERERERALVNICICAFIRSMHVSLCVAASNVESHSNLSLTYAGPMIVFYTLLTPHKDSPTLHTQRSLLVPIHFFFYPRTSHSSSVSGPCNDPTWFEDGNVSIGQQGDAVFQHLTSNGNSELRMSAYTPHNLVWDEYEG